VVSIRWHASLVSIPSTADRLELYARFERRRYTRTSRHDTSDLITLGDRVEDGFVSRFGQNFVAPVR
jgi:hypothetical protein